MIRIRVRQAGLVGRAAWIEPSEAEDSFLCRRRIGIGGASQAGWNPMESRTNASALHLVINASYDYNIMIIRYTIYGTIARARQSGTGSHIISSFEDIIIQDTTNY